MKFLALAALMGLSLNAATISFGPVSTTPSFNPGDQSSYVQFLNLPLFNPALGTLTGVEITVDTQLNKSGNMVNNGSNAASLGYTYGPTSIGVTGLGVVHSQVATAAFTVGQTFLNVPGSGGVVNIAALQEFDLGNVFNPGIAGFTGVGTTPYQVDAVANLFTSCGSGNCATNIATLMGAQISVTYTYTVDETGVPEPSTNLLMGAGLLLVGLIARKR